MTARRTRVEDQQSGPGQGWTIGHIVTDGARRWPGFPALSDGRKGVTFQQLADDVRLIAGALCARGVGRGDRVALWGRKHTDGVLALLAVMSLGAAVVPLDPHSPAERTRFMLRDVRPKVLLVGIEELERVAPIARELGISVFMLEAIQREALDSESDPTSADSAAPEDLAYLLYTSGSTGRPKAVGIEHRQVQSFLEGHNQRARLNTSARCLNTGPLHFDIFVLEILLPLWCGAFVRLGTELPSPTLVLRTIERERITHLYAVGSVLGLITGDGSQLERYDLSSLELLQTGAEICSARVVNEWLLRVPGLRFLNSYGPTEATVGCVSYVRESCKGVLESPVPIGTPHHGTRLLVVEPTTCEALDDEDVGELLIGGDQVMRGYHERPLEESRAFVVVAGERYYRSGDLVHRGEDGDLYFHGRVDSELKIRGHRVHPSELLQCLRSCPGIDDAFVGPCAASESLALGAVVKLAPGQREDSVLPQLNEHVRRYLPEYMRPRRVVVTDQLPRLSTGKTDPAAALQLLGGN